MIKPVTIKSLRSHCFKINMNMTLNIIIIPGFRPGLTQTALNSYSKWLEISDNTIYVDGENKGAYMYQLCGFREDDLWLCFRKCISRFSHEVLVNSDLKRIYIGIGHFRPQFFMKFTCRLNMFFS